MTLEEEDEDFVCKAKTADGLCGGEWDIGAFGGGTSVLNCTRCTMDRVDVGDKTRFYKKGPDGKTIEVTESGDEL